MSRTDVINKIGIKYKVSNTEKGEYSYIQAAGSKETLIKLLGRTPNHVFLDVRFKKDDVIILAETKFKVFNKQAIEQLSEYLEEEKAVHNSKKIIALLANTETLEAKVWKNNIDDEHLLCSETVVDEIEHYISLFQIAKQNNREQVLKNTYDLNELLHKMDIDEKLRSQFVGTTLLYIKKIVEDLGVNYIDSNLQKQLINHWTLMSEKEIRAAIENTLEGLLDNSKNKKKKIELLQKNVLNDQKVKKLTKENWIKVLDTILMDIYKYIDTHSSEGQDILNLFFIAFNKYTGKADKNQAFTPDHITEFMCRLTEVDRNKVVLDATCGSGSFLVQAMVKELADCHRGKTAKEAKDLENIVKNEHIFGIEVEEKAYGLATTNMLIHGDGNSNIEFGSCFDYEKFIEEADPDVILMNPPYNAKPISIPEKYKTDWSTKAKNGKADPTKGFVFIHYISDVIKNMNEKRIKNKQPIKTVKLAVLLPASAAIGTKSIIAKEKKTMLECNTLEAVFTLPDEVFYPGASVCACCMLFTLGQPHVKPDGTPRATFFGYCKDDGFKKKKNIGRIEQFDINGNSKWKVIEQEWLELFEYKKVVDGKSSVAVVDGDSEWLCEAYMKTDYSKLSKDDFQNTLKDYTSFLVKYGYYPTLVYSPPRVPELQVKDWKEFKISSLFSVCAGEYYPSDEYEEGNTPYISASDTDNGTGDWINLEPAFTGNKLSIGKIGATTYYQPFPFCATSDANILTPLFKMNKHHGLFIARVINSSENYKWSYGRQCRVGDTKEIVIKLPIQKDINGNPILDDMCKYSPDGYLPDWDWMENYIKSLPYGDKI